MGTLRLGSSVVVPSTVKQTTVPASIDPLSVTPTTSQQVINATASIDGYAPVTINAVTSAIDANITANNIKSGVDILGVTGNVVELKGETKTVIPRTYGQTLYPSTGKNGITQVTVDAVTSSIDSNIQAGNIKKDVSILGVTGTYEGGSGNFVGVPKVVNNGVLQNGSTIELGGATSLGQGVLKYAYYQNNALTTADLSGITSLGLGALDNTFNTANYLTTLDLSDLVYATDTRCMAQICSGCSRLVNVYLNSLEQVGTDYISTGSMRQAFNGCTSLITLDFPALKGIHGEYAMYFMCSGCTALQSIYFRALTSSGRSTYGNYMMGGMLDMCSNVTVHFPSNLQSVIGSWSVVTNGFGGTNTTVLFDLPATE